MTASPKIGVWAAVAIALVGLGIVLLPGQTKTPGLTLPLLLIWLAAVVACWSQRPSTEAVAVAAACLLVGVVGELRILVELAAALWVLAVCRRPSGSLLLVATIGWLPASDYLFGATAVPVRLATLALLPLAYLVRMRTVRLPARRICGPVLTVAGLVGLAGLTATTGAGPSLLADLPGDGLLYRSRDVPLRTDEAAHLANVEVVKRQYVVPAGQFELLAIDGAGDRHAVHDPTFCHRGAGWIIIDRQTLPLEHGSAAIVRYRRGAESTQCVYWFTNGKSQNPAAWWYWAQATTRRLSGGQLGREPVLVVLQPLEDHPPDWTRVMRELPSLAAF